MVMISKINLMNFSSMRKLREDEENTEKVTNPEVSFRGKGGDVFLKMREAIVKGAIDSKKFENGPISYMEGKYLVESRLKRDNVGEQIISRYTVGGNLEKISYSMHDSTIPEHTTYYENGHKVRKVYFWGDGETKRSESLYDAGMIKNTIFFAHDGKTKSYEKIFDENGVIKDFILYDNNGNFKRSFKK